MKTGLTKRQKTTCIYFDEASKTVEIQTHNTALKKRLTQYAAEHPDLCRQTDAVSYTHLDVYKRQLDEAEAVRDIVQQHLPLARQHNAARASGKQPDLQLLFELPVSYTHLSPQCRSNTPTRPRSTTLPSASSSASPRSMAMRRSTAESDTLTGHGHSPVTGGTAKTCLLYTSRSS